MHDERSLNTKQFNIIMQRIREHHRFARGGWNIKYVRPSFDLRDGSCFIIQFEGLFETIIFDFRDTDETMLYRISQWLSEREIDKS